MKGGNLTFEMGKNPSDWASKSIPISANTKNECVGDSAANYKLWGRWDEVNKICYCPLSSGIMYPEGRSEVGNFINNCDLCVQIGSGDTNAGCVTTSD